MLVAPEEPLTDISGYTSYFTLNLNDGIHTLEGKKPNIILRVSGLFVDTTDGNDETGNGSLGKPYKTFKKSGEVLEKRLEKDPNTAANIIVKEENGARVTGDDTLLISDEYKGRVKVIPYRDKGQVPSLITIPEGTSFTAKNVEFNGKKGDKYVASNIFTVNGGALLLRSGTTTSNAQSLNAQSGYLIKVTKGTCTAEEGSELYSIYWAVQLIDGTVKLGGVVTSDGSSYGGVKMEGGQLILQKTASITKMASSGIHATGGTIELQGASITNCGRYYDNGGGIWLGRKAKLHITSDSMITGCGRSGYNGGAFTYHKVHK